MSVCCPPTRIEFFNEAITTIAYSPSMRAQYGSEPRIFVYYVDPITNELYLSNSFLTTIHFNTATNVITVDHGGPNSGIIVIT